MKNVLIINSSLNGSAGNSNQLTASFVSQLQQQAEVKLTQRDLYDANLPHLSSEEMQAWMTDKSERSEEQQQLAAVSDQLIEEIQQSDIVVIGMPMYNFGVPSVFKAWIDRIARAGITFRYTENGPQGLIEGKKVYVLAARGGLYVGTEKDSQSQYLKDVLSFIGMSDIEFVYAEGLAMGEESAQQSFVQANDKIFELIEKQIA
ncbi:FMN-dependent NADH-azoreductase [Lacimicrobium alkaliphilum]|uniref:FMN dependent NADH:quinone oxidoreductase n=1 Tax=Lacimicrobium alkaliphilum TaxID=1526571 RepID=A0ABQ1R4R5_9ALTE|nr:NAD(P)H-dependent oxidoreductase [Lacimicrobium alkaliphilum]GGD54635.1 FMN-dependent NADH-azoreductase [Lacimicrobium alkaliphilum]